MEGEFFGFFNLFSSDVQVVQTRHFLQTRVDKLSHENKQLQNQLDDLVVENAELEERYKKQVSINSSEQVSPPGWQFFPSHARVIGGCPVFNYTGISRRLLDRFPI